MNCWTEFLKKIINSYNTLEREMKKAFKEKNKKIMIKKELATLN